MKLRRFAVATLSPLLFSALGFAASLPDAPTDPHDPGSRQATYSVRQESLSCSSRQVDVYIPSGGRAGEEYPVVVYGHGQGLSRTAYEETFLHLAGKGVAVIFPTYDNGFFDQDWNRMGADYSRLTDCALQKFPQLNPTQIVYSGHSKGAYVASIAAGLAAKSKVASPGALLVFETAGFDAVSVEAYDPKLVLTVVFGDADTLVERSLSENLYAKAPVSKKQFIFVKSYVHETPALSADHMWPLTQATVFGGQSPNALHYFGSWRWLVAAALDLRDHQDATNPYVYGANAGDKGVGSYVDEIRRSW